MEDNVSYFRDSDLSNGAVWACTTRKLWHEGYWVGYREVPLRYMVRCSDRRWRRLYARPIGNVSVCYVKHKGELLIVDECDIH